MKTIEKKLKDVFDKQVVLYKDLKRQSNVFSALTLPSFMRDWLLNHFEDNNGNFNIDEITEYVHRYIPKKEDWNTIKDKIINNQEEVKIIAKISADIDIATGQMFFSLPDFGVSYKDTIIDKEIWDKCKDDLMKKYETWGLIKIGYQYPDEYEHEYSYDYSMNKDHSKSGKKGKIKLLSFKQFCPYILDQSKIEFFKNARREFSISQWIDIILGAVDYNADGYENEEVKLSMLTRLLPFVEKRLNLIELAPKSTGKTYLYGRVSRYGWLVGGSKISRAKMFYDQNRRKEGLVAGYDFITLDEAQTISFTDIDEMRTVLKQYLEYGIYTVGNYQGSASAGIVLCGNIDISAMREDINMFTELPSEFQESALIDRFHGFIKGWKIPRMNDDLKASGWALSSEYFCSIMHELREDITYRAVVNDLVNVPEKADTRDTNAVKKIATAYLKLLFPHVKKASDISPNEFKKYCLDRAIEMRKIIKHQLGLIDDEYKGKEVPLFTVRF